MTLDSAHSLAASRNMLCQEDVDLIQKTVKKYLMFRMIPEVIDIGAGSGTTALAVLCANGSAVVHSVDTDKRNLDWAEEAVKQAGFHNSWAGWNMDSAAFAEKLGYEPDLILIDGDHSYEGVKRDIEAFVPRVRQGGYIWFHDYHGPEKYGVEEAVDEAITDGRLAVVEKAGWGILTRKP